MREDLVSDLPAAIDVDQREDIGEGDRAPKVRLINSRYGHVVVHLHRSNLGLKGAINVRRLGRDHGDHIGDGDVDSLTTECSEDPGVFVECGLEGGGVASGDPIDVELDGSFGGRGASHEVCGSKLLVGRPARTGLLFTPKWRLTVIICGWLEG
jgi:hypothetical protein